MVNRSNGDNLGVGATRKAKIVPVSPIVANATK